MRLGYDGHHDALDQFRRARRRAGLECIQAKLRRRSASLLCSSQIVDLLGPQVNRSLGLLEIPISAITGSVGRCYDFTRGFMPLNDSDQERWTRIMGSFVAASVLPPIRTYRVGPVHFVVDGHHRASVARQRGFNPISAEVVEIRPREPLSYAGPEIPRGPFPTQDSSSTLWGTQESGMAPAGPTCQ